MCMCMHTMNTYGYACTCTNPFLVLYQSHMSIHMKYTEWRTQHGLPKLSMKMSTANLTFTNTNEVIPSAFASVNLFCKSFPLFLSETEDPTTTYHCTEYICVKVLAMEEWSVVHVSWLLCQCSLSYSLEPSSA